MKICFIGVKIVPSKDGAFIGGLVNNIVRLAKEFSDSCRGHEIPIRHKECETKLYLFKKDLTYDE